MTEYCWSFGGEEQREWDSQHVDISMQMMRHGGFSSR
jgi:hypothetical protein